MSVREGRAKEARATVRNSVTTGAGAPGPRKATWKEKASAQLPELLLSPHSFLLDCGSLGPHLAGCRAYSSSLLPPTSLLQWPRSQTEHHSEWIAPQIDRRSEEVCGQ